LLAANADDYSVSRSLEAYLLWLFGFIMFQNAHGNSVDKILISYAREIADAEEGAVPTYSWASAVLAATYRGLCDACSKTEHNAVLAGCPLLLQLWAYERIAVGRPAVDLTPYDHGMYRDHAEEAPTMGTLWLVREVSISNLVLQFIVQYYSYQ
jgi:Plant mobile domain